MPSPEELAREKIDALLQQCGWILQNRRTINLLASRGVAIREALLKDRDEVDYLLFVDGKAIGTVEAKPEGYTLTGVEEQSGKYGKGLLHSRINHERRFTFSAPYSKDGVSITTKEMPVRILQKQLSKDVPPVLAGLACSQYHGRRTFTEIGHWGNLKAIDYVLGQLSNPKLFEQEHWNLKYQTAAQLLECLGSTELETLVAKLFEARGCHVPAYLGGTLRDVDVLAYNGRSSPVDVNGISIEPGGRISLQVKTWSNEHRSDAVDYLISLSPPPDPKSFGPEWILRSVKQTPSVLTWMKRSLNWLPRKFLEKFGL